MPQSVNVSPCRFAGIFKLRFPFVFWGVCGTLPYAKGGEDILFRGNWFSKYTRYSKLSVLMSMKNTVKPIFTKAFATLFSPLTIVAWIAAIVVAVVAGPFGTLEAMGFFQRLIFWSIAISVSLCLGYFAREVALQIAGPRRPALSDAVAVALMTLIFAPFVWCLARYVEAGGDRSPPTLPETFFYVFVVTAAVFVVRRLTPGIETQTYRFLQRNSAPGTAAAAQKNIQSAPAPQPSRPQPRLFRRLPAQARARVLRLSAQDHHVNVVTETATISLRMRLKDAIDEMEPVVGFCTHRSHWVARDEIVRVCRDGPHKLVVELSNGDQVPISRTYRPKLVKEGFLPPSGPRAGALSAASAQDAARDRSSPQPPRGA